MLSSKFSSKVISCCNSFVFNSFSAFFLHLLQIHQHRYDHYRYYPSHFNNSPCHQYHYLHNHYHSKFGCHFFCHYFPKSLPKLCPFSLYSTIPPVLSSNSNSCQSSVLFCIKSWLWRPTYQYFRDSLIHNPPLSTTTPHIAT